MATLKISRPEAAELLVERIEAGGKLMERAANVPDKFGYDAWKLDKRRWINLTADALRHAYTVGEPAKEFVDSTTHAVYFAGGTWQDHLIEAADDVQRAMNTLESLRERLRFAQDPSVAEQVRGPASSDGPRVIFLVHGRDVGARAQVEHFLNKAGNHKVVVLEELANRGRTLIEKLEEHAAEAKYAVVLLTGDDEGGSSGVPMQPRARQNVVLELGWFCGLIGRENVTVLYEPGVELPSDIDGLVYVPFEGDWKIRLVRELRDSGHDFSLDRI